MTTKRATPAARASGNTVGGSRGLYIIALALAVMCIGIGAYLFGSVVASNGWKSQWRIALAISFATSVLDTLGNEAQHWSN